MRQSKQNSVVELSESSESTVQYLAITHKTAAWLQTKANVVERLGLDISADRFDSVANADFVEGALRISGSPDGALVALWNIDYLNNTGQESWGLVCLDARRGLNREPRRLGETFERAVFVISQRLQGLKLEGVGHRYWSSEKVHTCSAERDVRPQLALGFAEAEIDGENALLIVGPVRGYQPLLEMAMSERKKMRSLVASANALVSPTTSRALMEANILGELRELLAPAAVIAPVEWYPEQQSTLPIVGSQQHYNTYRLDYLGWIADSSPLAAAQRRIHDANVLRNSPLRLRGPAGSGKTLLMQLLAAKQLFEDHDRRCKVLYVTHNAAMAQSVMNRFAILGLEEELTNGRLDVSTLAEYGRRELELPVDAVIDVDAEKSKQFQLDAVKRALRKQLSVGGSVKNSLLIHQAQSNDSFFSVFARLIVAEISVAIKGWGAENDEQRYVQSEKSLSRLHGIMSHDERGFVFSVFRRYHEDVFEAEQVLDSDDVAISLYLRLRAPLWELKRRGKGYDFVFVDEAQLFNENEKRVFHLLTRGDRPYVPIAIALDQAQDLMGQSAALGTFGINGFNTETQDLRSSHRCAPAIRKLAYFVISQSTDLFSVDEYPDFTNETEDAGVEDRYLDKRPMLWNLPDRALAPALLEKIRGIKRMGLTRIAIVILSDDYKQLAADLTREDPTVKELERRGEPLGEKPVVVVSRPSYIGGQEFEAVVAVGLEEGVVPQQVDGADTLNFALTQQAYREIYLTFSRARYQLYVVVRGKMHPTEIMREARKAGLINYS